MATVDTSFHGSTASDFGVSEIQVFPPVRMEYVAHRSTSYILITVERDEDDNWIVSEQEFGIYGVGRTKLLATRDFLKSCAEYRDIVEESARENSQSRALLQRLDGWLGRSQ